MAVGTEVTKAQIVAAYHLIGGDSNDQPYEIESTNLDGVVAFGLRGNDLDLTYLIDRNGKVQSMGADR